MAVSNYEHDDWIKKRIRRQFRGREVTALDVGPGAGRYADAFGSLFTMDAVEISQAYVDKFGLVDKYRQLFVMDACAFEFDYYDLIIAGDVLEHMSVESAQRFIRYCVPRCEEMLVCVPWLYHQGPEPDNPWQAHQQPDLTDEMMARRYPELKLVRGGDIIGVYMKA